MIARALPEGVLEAGGTLDGYLYFERVAEEEATPVVLHADLQAAENDQKLASLSMPFVVE